MQFVISENMIRRILKTLLNILFEIISFLLLIPVLLIACIVLLLTGKFSAFALRTRKANTNSENSGLIERNRSFFHRGHTSKERLMVAANAGEKVRLTIED